MNQNPHYSVPQGYFENLQARLSAIPAQEQKAAQPTPWVRVRPYLAMAAAFAALVVSGTALLQHTARNANDLSYDELLSYSQLIPRTDPYMIYNDELEIEDEYTEDDIINYLIETGVPLELLAYEADR